MIQQTLTGGLDATINKDKMVRLCIIAVNLGLPEDSFEELINRAAEGIDESADCDNSIVTLTAQMQATFNRRASIYGAGAINITQEIPRTHVLLQQLSRQLANFEAASDASLAVDFTTEEAANFDVSGEIIRDIVTYYNSAATPLGLPVI